MIVANFLKRAFILTAIITCLMSWAKPRPTVFLMGDSISIHYGPYLIKYLEGTLDIDQKKIETLQGKEFSRNGGDSRRVLAYLTAKLQQPGFKPDYLLLNCGLHDVGHDSITQQLQVPPDEYRKNLRSIFTLIQKNKIRIVWVTTTPVVDSIHNSRTKHLSRYAADLEQYNGIAAEVCKQYKVSTIDLHDFTVTLGPGAYLDNVHYKEDIRALQASYIAGALREIVKENKAVK